MNSLRILSISLLCALCCNACSISGSLSEKDQRIITHIEKQYRHDPYLAERGLEVHSHEGMVRIRGVLTSYAEKKRAMGIAASTPSVKGVTANIFVK